MKIALYDHRKKHTFGYYQDLGHFDHFFLNARGAIRVGKGDFLYSLDIELTKKEMEALRRRLNELHDRRRPGKGALILEDALLEAREILDQAKDSPIEKELEKRADLRDRKLAEGENQ